MHIDIIQLDVSTGPNAEQAPNNFFTSRFLDDNSESVEEIDPAERLYDRLNDLVRDERTRIETQLDEFGDDLKGNLSEMLFNPVESGISYFRREAVSPLPAKKFTKEDFEVVLLELEEKSPKRRYIDNSGELIVRESHSSELEPTFLLLADSKDDISRFVDFYESEVTEVDRIVGEFMKLEAVNDGKDIVEQYFDDRTGGDYVSDWYVEETDDEFEEEVYNTVNSLTGVCLPNVNVESTVGESPEYDVVTLPVGPSGNSYAIEAKNYDREQVNEEDQEFGNLRYNLITQPKEDADRVDLDLITVVKGLEDDQFENLKRHADPSNVVLLRDDNYKNNLREILIEENLREMVRRLS